MKSFFSSKFNDPPRTIKPVTEKQFSKFSVSDRLAYLCLLGHLAPSSHNSQPWRFFIDKENWKIHVYLNRASVLPESDVAGRQAVISLGCCVENIVVGASHLGLKAAVKYFSVTNSQVRFSQGRFSLAEISFSAVPTKNQESILYHAIFTRKVMRSEFNPEKSLPVAVVEKLTAVSGESGVKLHIVKNALQRLMLSEFQAQADSYVINSPEFSHELGQWLLPNNTKSFVGMPGIGFGLKDDQAVRLHKGLLNPRELQAEDGLRFSVAGKLAIEKSPFIGLLMVKKDNVQYWLAAGRALQHMLLILESQGFYTAIHAAVAEVALINKIFAASFGSLNRLVILFRAGVLKNHADKNRPYSPRLPLKYILLKEKF